MVIMLRVLSVCCLLFTQVGFASLRDPTRPENFQGSSTMGQIQTGELQAIIISKDRKVAIYNGQILKLGSQFAGFKVVAIKPNTVHLEGPDGKMTLFLFNQSIKKLTGKPI